MLNYIYSYSFYRGKHYLLNSKPILLILIFYSIFSYSACMNRELVRIDPVTETYVTDKITTSGSVGVDVLVMVDNSGSMADEQTLLSRNFPELIRELLQPVDAVNNDTGEPFPDGRADHVPIKSIHIGIVSSDMGTCGYETSEPTGCSLFGDDGKLQHIPNPNVSPCDSNYPAYLEYESEEFPPPREPNSPALPEIEKLANDFACIAILGTKGCGFEQQMEVVLKALTVHIQDGVNSGFLRYDTILAILFVTDEEDCSVDITNPENLRIFDPAFDQELGPMNRRCTLHEEMVYNVDRYVTGLTGLRDPVEDLVMGMIVGVPPADKAPECNGFIGEIDSSACLARDDMQAEPDPNNQEMMKQSCVSTDPNKGAYPPRRFIQLAQRFMALNPEKLSQNVYIHSICTDDYSPAITAITNKIHEIADRKNPGRELEIEKNSADPRGCTCVANCMVLETLPVGKDCILPKETYDGNNDTFPDYFEDEEGKHQICKIPHSGMTITGGDCECCLRTTENEPGNCICSLSCIDPEAKLQQKMCGEEPCPGWWYDPYYDPDGAEGPNPPGPMIMFKDVMPEEGSTTNIMCKSIVCPSLRKCGAGKCCHSDEFCYFPDGNEEGEGLCLMRRDVCDLYGDDLWCPWSESEPPPAGYDGICCVDFNFDGILDLKDTGGDTLPDTPLMKCNGSECVER